MRRMTIYLPEVLCDEIAAHADAAGQKLSTFIGRAMQNHVNHLSSLVHKPKPKPEANAKREAR